MEINDIMVAISRKLQTAFGSSYKKYMDEVPQGFATPAFFIQFLHLESIPQIGKRWKIHAQFNVQYFPKNSASESSNMSLKVQRALNEVTLLNSVLMRSTSKSSEVIDGIGHNFMNFNFYLQEIEAKVLMGSLDHYQKTKGRFDVTYCKNDRRNC